MEYLNTHESFKKHRFQRDSARKERDMAIFERDSAISDIKKQKNNFEKDICAQDQFIATLSHDLKNPISAIKMAVEIIRMDNNENIPEDMMNLIDRNADQAGDLINQLLDVHLIRSGEKLPMTFESTNLMELINCCLNTLSPGDHDKICLTPYIANAIKVIWDPKAIKRVIKNLLSNALKYSGDNKAIHIILEQNKDTTVIKVQNFGEIISISDQQHIFDTHVRIPQNHGHTQGWGLGLALVKGIVEAHQGKVEVTSSKVEGTTFTIILPNDARIKN